jgi:DNA invertase Pin-like site-specific DNA recombinase
MAKFAAYVRVSDSNKQTGETQRSDIETYTKENNIHISKWVEENVSASKTDVEDRQLMTLVNDGYSIVMTDVTRLGRRKVFELLGVIGQICKVGELHFTYTSRIVNSDNMDDAETIFTIVGGSFAAVDEAKKRSQRAKAAHAKRKSQGLSSGRAKGAVVKSKLDEHAAFILNELNKETKKTHIITLLEKIGVSVSRQQLYRWIDKRTVT